MKWVKEEEGDIARIHVGMVGSGEKSHFVLIIPQEQYTPEPDRKSARKR